jgi:integrase
MAGYFVSSYPQRPTTPWKLTIPESVAGRRIRRFYATEAEAWAAAPELLEKLRKGGTDALEKEKSERGMTITSAVRDYLRTKQGVSEAHMAKMKRVTDALLEAFQGPVSAVSPMRAAQWFAKVEGAPTTRAGWHRYASGFFGWCVDMEILERNPLRRVAAPKAESKRSLLLPRELRTILEAEMSDELRAWFLLGAFAGLRSIEVLRMRWEDVDARAAQIEVRREVSKQSSGLPERIVDFTEPLRRRKKFFTGKKGRISGDGSLKLYREREALIAALHKKDFLPWPALPENALRHSYATYHLARGQDAAKTAHQLGHSTTALVLRTYAVPARKVDWRAWWRL